MICQTCGWPEPPAVNERPPAPICKACGQPVPKHDIDAVLSCLWQLRARAEARDLLSAWSWSLVGHRERATPA